MQIIGCPMCGTPLEEPGGACAQCGKTGLSSETAPNFKETASVQQAPLTDIPVVPAPEEKTILPASLEAGTVSYAVATLAPVKGLTGLVETEPTLHVLPRASSSASKPLANPASNAAARGQDAAEEAGETDMTMRLPGRATLRPRPQAASQLQAEADATIYLPHQAARRRKMAPPTQTEAETTLRLPERKHSAHTSWQAWTGGRAGLEDDLFLFDEMAQDDADEEEMAHHESWHLEVPHKASRPIPAVGRRSLPAPAWFSRLTHLRATRSFFWLSTLVLIALLLSGAFGIAASFGRTRAVPNPPPALLVSPATIEMGGIVTIRGTHFTPGGEVTLSRDQHIPLLDTGNVSTLQANAQGSFSDSIVADPQWLAGKHILYATDMHLHQQALMPILVTGKNALQGPPHLLLSSGSLDLGAGDQVTNASKLMALSNAGGGVATWQASASQSWLQITPQSGSVASGQHASVIVAADRSRLTPGNYQATITFTSNTGQLTLPVSLQVTVLQQSHQAVMQVSPATLAFAGAARGSAPDQQAITISNPGSRPLVWGAGIHGAGWLWTSPSSGTIAPGSQQTIIVGVTTDGLDSGVYKGEIAFVKQGLQPVQGSPQSVYVSLTVTPACTLALSSSSMGFSGQHGAASPASQSLSIGIAQGCQSSQSWSATTATSSGGSWLHVSASHGVTPAKISVSANTAGLAPGTYQGTLTFSSSAGSQLLTVTLTVMPVPCSVSGSSALSLQGTAGQSSAVAANVPISAAGDCAHALSWTSSSNSSWLSGSPGGTFTSSASLKIQADLSNVSAGTYSGSVTFNVVDSVTGQAIGSVVISVTLTAQPSTPPANPCALGSPSSNSLGFSASAGSDPAAPSASVTISVTGTCASSITIIPSADDNGGGWLTVSGPVTIASGSTATFTVTVASATLTSGTYTGTITLSASNGISGSPHSITVTLTVQ